MSAGAAALKRILQRKFLPREVALLIVLFVFLCSLAVRHLGWIQFLEFRTYDFFIRHQPKVPTGPIVLIEMTESDIHSPSLDWPIYDEKLAELLTKLDDDGPAVIGLDIWRDIPVPKNGQGIRELNRVLLSRSNIVAIFTLGGIAAPAVLKTNSDRIAFNDNLVVDSEVDRTIPKVRRSMLFTNSPSGESFDSLPFHLAVSYLQRLGIEPEPDPEDPTSLRLGKARLRPFQPNDGAYVGAGCDNFQMLLDFRCSDDFTRFSFSQALAGRIPPGTLRGKVVLVGINTQSVFDERVTPIRRDHRGIEVQALIVNQLLRRALDGQKPLRFWNDWVEDIWIFLWCIAGGAVGYWVRSPWRLAPTTTLCLAGLGGIAWSAFAFGWWIPLAAPALAYAPAVALVTSYVSFHEKKQRGQLMQLFAKQVSPDIAQALWEQREEFLAGQRPRSQKLIATVLFTDLVGFSAISEKLEPALLLDWLNEYMESMATAIMSHEGVVEKYIGDAIMAVFGVPIARATQEEIRQDAKNAVRCALAMRTRLDQLNTQWVERGLPLSGMRIGIHTGPLVAGSLGSAERQEYTVIGDSVNTASRLESFDKDWSDPETTEKESRCRILISEGTHLFISGDFQTKRVGTMSLKNKQEPVTVYQLLSETNENQTTAQERPAQLQ
jgi:adenylate cyclase